MAEIKWDSKIILVKTEETEGVDAAPTGALNAMLMTGVSFTPMDGDDVSRELEYPYLSADRTVPSGLRGSLKGRIEITGSGVAGTPPKWAPVYKACRVNETVTPGVSVIYKPVSDNMDSATIHFWIGETRHALTGARGNATKKWTAQGIPYLDVDLMGLWSQPTETARPNAVLTGFADPALVSKAFTPTFTVNGVALVMREVTLALGNKVEPRLLVPTERIIITGTAEKLSCRVEAVPLGTFNPYALAAARTEVPVVLVHGVTAGNIVRLDVPSAQMKRLPGFENAQNRLEWPLELTPLPVNGDDQWTLTLT